MIIHQPVIKENADEISIAAEIEIRNQDRSYPRELWFKFPLEYREHLTDRTDGFAAALLPLAMQLGENLEIRGELSYGLAYGLREYQRIQTAWKPKFFTPIDIHCERLRSPAAGEARGAVGTAFSGGVDSFHTLWSHLPQNEPLVNYRISHGLIINGFDMDMDLDQTGSFYLLQQVYQSILQKYRIELLVSRTNIRQFIDLVLLKQCYAAVVASSALILGRLFSRFYLPSSDKFTEVQLIHEGSQIMLDHLISTETMATILDSSHLTRVDKTAVIAQWPDTYHALRVCFNKTLVQEETGTIQNCCRCEKCIRTMTTLKLFEKLHCYTVFPKPLKRRHIRRLKYISSSMLTFPWAIFRQAVRSNRILIAFDIAYAIWINIILWKPLHDFFVFCAYLEKRSKLFSKVGKPAKTFIKQFQWGKGWLYS